MTLVTPQFQHHIPLPDGHRFRNWDIGFDERTEVLYDAGLITDETFDESLRAIRWMDTLGARVLEVGVDKVDATGATRPQLVGYGTAVIAGDEVNLCNLAVLPESRGQGIGKAIVLERVRQAKAARGIKRVVSNGLEPTNTIASYYTELGFVELPLGFLVLELGVGARALQRVRGLRQRQH